MDIFADFELEEQEKEERLRWITPIEYKAENHEDEWFMKEEQNKLIDKRDLLYQRASYLNHLKKYEEALIILEKIKNEFEHKGAFFKFMIEDSILSTALMIPSFPILSLLSMLDTLRCTVVNYGDQVQYFSLCSKVYYRSGNSLLHLRSLIFLSSYLDLPSNWIDMINIPLNMQGPNFRLGCIIKAELLILFQLEMAKGFVKEKMKKELKNVQDILEREYSKEQCEYARIKMRNTVVVNGMNDDLSRGVHQCRWNEGTLLTLHSSHSIIHSFHSNYQWLLIQMDNMIEEMILIPHL